MPNQPFITITQSETDQYVHEVTYQHAGFESTEYVDLAPNPTWPSPSEQADALTAAVRKVFSDAHEWFVGERIDQ